MRSSHMAFRSSFGIKEQFAFFSKKVNETRFLADYNVNDPVYPALVMKSLSSTAF